MAGLLHKLLALPHTSSQSDIDDPNTTLIHRDIILSKPFLKKIYLFWYQEIIKTFKSTDKVLEIGSGGGFLKEVFPSVITSDIMPLPNCDMVVDATDIPYEKNSLDGIVMVNVFHHIPDSEKFLNEAQRVLKNGGKIVMVEPAYSGWSNWVYNNFHHEPFDPTMVNWKFESTGPMSSSNQALPYIVFDRDKELFNQKFLNLEITSIKYHTPFSYLMSGGVSMKSLMPSFMYSFIHSVENLISSKNLNMFWTVEITKR